MRQIVLDPSAPRGQLTLCLDGSAHVAPIARSAGHIHIRCLTCMWLEFDECSLGAGRASCRMGNFVTPNGYPRSYSAREIREDPPTHLVETSCSCTDHSLRSEVA